MSLYTQLKLFPVSNGAAILDDDVIYVNASGVEKKLPFSELPNVLGSGLPALTTRVTNLENADTAFDIRLDADETAITALQNGILFLTPQMYGAIADGATHPLSTVYASLAAAQAVYPFATTLTQEIDYCALKKMSDTALGAYTVEHGETNRKLNRPMFLLQGSYWLGNDTWLIRNTSGMKLWGAGKRSTTIQSNQIVLQFDGLWFSDLADFTIESMGAAIAALDLDGNVPAHPYATRGVQGNNLRNLYIKNSGGQYSFAMCRQGGSGGQGSENTYTNVHLEGGLFSPYYQNGFNALANKFLGGNFQAYPLHGAYFIAGSASFYDTGFQSTYGYQQVLNGGYDIAAFVSGAGERFPIIGCRTESLQFAKFGAANSPVLIANQQLASVNTTWTNGVAVALNDVIIKSDGYRNRLYVVTTAGITGGVEPTWPQTGTVADGTAVWTMTRVNVVDTYTYYSMANSWRIPDLKFVFDGEHPISTLAGATIVANYKLQPEDELLCVDTTAGNITITLDDTEFASQLPVGKRVIIKKTTTDANTITVTNSPDAGLGPDGANAVIPGGSRGYLTIERGPKTGLNPTWWIISKSF